MAKWQIKIPNFVGGVAPAATSILNSTSYPEFGDTNQASATKEVDLRNPNYLQPSPALATCTNGTEAGAVTQAITAISRTSTVLGLVYAGGGNKVYRISVTTVTNSGDWPHTIDKAAVTDETVSDVAEYKGNLYYVYNHSGTTGDVGRYASATFDDDWGSTVPSGAATLTGGVPHPICVAGNDVLYIANGRYVTSYDGTTFIQQALDLPTGTVISSIVWNNDRLWIFAYKQNANSSIYIWDGTTNSWEVEIPVTGVVGGALVYNGVTYFTRKKYESSGFTLSYTNGQAVIDVFTSVYGGNGSTLTPSHFQMTEYDGFILVEDAVDVGVWAWGSNNQAIPARTFMMFNDGTGSVVNVIGKVGQSLLVSSSTGAAHKLEYDSTTNYSVATQWKSLTFDVSGSAGYSRINTVGIRFEKLTSGVRVDWTLRDSGGRAIHSDTISYAKLGAATQATYKIGKIAQDCRIEFTYENGSSTVPLRIKSVYIDGDTQE